MNIERRIGESGRDPFPIHDDLVRHLLGTHQGPDVGRDATVAHVLGTVAGYSYADLETVTTMMGRLGLDDCSCVRVSQSVDAMLIFSTAYLVQSRCGRVVILSYRGTEPANLGNWLGDADVGSDSIRLGGEPLGVHSGFYRNVRATQFGVLNELHRAMRGDSLGEPDKRLDHSMEALYVTGHSLGGAMAALFTLLLAGHPEHQAVVAKLRATYTFGQPLAAGEPLPPVVRAITRRVFRHVNAGDIVPALPPAGWGRFAHFGHEYRYAAGEWLPSATPVAQLAHLREIPRAAAAFFGAAKARKPSRYNMIDHGPHRYIAALRPEGRVTEFGDRE